MMAVRLAPAVVLGGKWLCRPFLFADAGERKLPARSGDSGHRQAGQQEHVAEARVPNGAGLAFPPDKTQGNDEVEGRTAAEPARALAGKSPRGHHQEPHGADMVFFFHGIVPPVFVNH